MKKYKVQKVPDRNSKKNFVAKERAKVLLSDFVCICDCCIMDDETYVLGNFSQLPGQEFYVAEEFRVQKRSKFPKKFLVLNLNKFNIKFMSLYMSFSVFQWFFGFMRQAGLEIVSGRQFPTHDNERTSENIFSKNVWKDRITVVFIYNWKYKYNNCKEFSVLVFYFIGILDFVLICYFHLIVVND